MTTRKKHPIPICPDPDKYVLVQTKEGMFWRRKRGTVRKAILNEAFTVNAQLAKSSGPIAVALVQQLRGYITSLQTGRVTLRISNAIRRSLKEDGAASFRYMKGMDIQADYPMNNLLSAPYQCVVNENSVFIAIPLSKGSVKQYSRLISHFYFEVIMIHKEGDVFETESIESRLYGFDEDLDETCKLTLLKPGNVWMVLLKVSCLEGNELAKHYKHYGMKVLEVSGA
jgi:hypothetical protein